MTQRSGSRPPKKSKTEEKASPSTAANRPNAPGGSIKRRINPRAVVGLLIGLLAVVGGIVAVAAARSSRGDAALLVQAREQSKNKKPETALSYLDAYLSRRPNDLEALDLRARILADVAHDGNQILEAAAAFDLLIRRAPNDPAAQDRRARLVELYIQTRQFVPGPDIRYRTAEAVAREYLAIEAKRPRGSAPADPIRDAKVHRLLGEALIGEAFLGDLKAISGRSDAETGAADELRAAQKLDPTNVPIVETLAGILVGKMSPDAKAGAVEARAALDRLIQAEKAARKPTAAARLARFRILSFLADGKPAELKRARAELDEARKLAPNDVDVLLTSAESELALKDFPAARRDLEAIPKEYRDNLRVREFEGRLELSRFHPELAVESWRKALVSVGGVNADLTFRVAFIELVMDRVAEAEPLIAQLVRLSDRKDAPEILCLQALRELRLRRPNRSLAILEKLRPTINSSSVEVQNRIYLVRGQTYEALGDRAKALEQYHAAAALSPTVPALRIQAARVALAAGGDRAYDQAAEELRRGLVDMPDEPLLLLEMLDVELRRQLRLAPDRRSWRTFDAVAARAAAAAPNAPELIRAQADYLAATGDLDRAVSQTRAAVKQDPKNPELWRILAAGLSRQGKLEEAARVLERAMAVENAGDQAPLRILWARLQTLLGRGREARVKLTDHWQTLPPDQRASIWKAAAELARARGQAEEGRDALVQWAALEPDNPQPALSLLETALADDDRDALKTATGLIAKIPTYQGVYSAIARLQELLRDSAGGTSTDKKDRQRQLDEADKLVKEIQAKAPRLWVGFAQEGRLRELQNQPEAALKAYRQARELGGASVVSRLILLLTRLKRVDEIAELRNSFANDMAIDRLAAETSLNLGDRDQAEALAGQVVSGDPDGLDSRQWQARVLSNLGESAKAEATLREYIARHPGEPAPLLTLLQYQVGLKRPAEAIAETLSQIDDQVRGDRAEFVRAQCRRVAGDFKTAETLYRASLAKWPNDPAVTLGTADFLYRSLKRPEEAEKIFRDRLERDKTDSTAARGLAAILASRTDNTKNNWIAAWDLIKPGAPAFAQTPIDRLIRAQILSMQLDRRPEAIKELESLLADLPIDRTEAINGRELLAQLYRQSQEPDKALEVLRVGANAPGRTDTEAIVRYLFALLDVKKTAEAARQFDRLVELQPKAVRTDALHAKILEAEGKTDEAVAVLMQAYESRAETPNFEAAGSQVIADLKALKRFDEADKIARDLSKRKPTLSWMVADVAFARGKSADALALCQASLDAGEPLAAAEVALKVAGKAAQAEPVDTATMQRAVAFIEKIQAKTPDDPQLLVVLANARYLQGRYEDQVNLYRKAIDKTPLNQQLFLNSLAYILGEELNRPADALKTINQCLDQVGPIPNVLDTKALILIRLNRNDEAIRVLNDALSTASGSLVGTIQFHISLAERQAGRPELAKKALELARKAHVDPSRFSTRERKEWQALNP